MDPAHAVSYLRSLIPSPGDVWNEPFGLARIEALLDMLGNPHHDQRFVHVGGTSGKGSTATILAGILEAAGYRTGLHVSPHIVSPGERAQVDGRPASLAQLAALAERVRDAAARLPSPPSFFEALFAIALLRFREARTDINVVEVGLGGRLDATNVIESKHQILTNIGLDHTDILGHTRAAILADKQGIVELDSTVVSGIRDRRLRDQLRCHICETRSQVSFVGTDFQYREVRGTCDSFGFPTGTTFTFRGPAGTLRALKLGVPGTPHVANAALAVAMAHNLAPEWQLDDTAIRRGLRAAHLPGRFHIVSARPLTILDGAHNPSKVRWLVRALREAFPTRRFITVFRYKPRRDVWKSLRSLAEISQHIILTQSDTPGDMGPEPGYDADALARAREEFGASHHDSPRWALARATRLAESAPDLGVVATGSIYMLQELLGAEG